MSPTGTGQLLVAVLLLAAGNHDEAMAAATRAAQSSTDIQRRAHAVRIRRLVGAADRHLPAEVLPPLHEIATLLQNGPDQQ